MIQSYVVLRILLCDCDFAVALPPGIGQVGLGSLLFRIYLGVARCTCLLALASCRTLRLPSFNTSGRNAVSLHCRKAYTVFIGDLNNF